MSKRQPSGKHSGPRKAPTGPIKVYWVMDGTTNVYFSYVDSIDFKKGIVHLTGDSWMPLKECYLTPQAAVFAEGADLAAAADVIEERVNQVEVCAHELFGCLRRIGKEMKRLK